MGCYGAAVTHLPVCLQVNRRGPQTPPVIWLLINEEFFGIAFTRWRNAHGSV